ncbi:hypothetical protein [Fredinandcohnia quinoae]|uniref:Lipoprotein n=1 Tax=Fredinandcohnia quinoae TaxID=2918902 RepID=A0AAW5E0J6_9BACI|nr:hypothetical protein [Fredinandcohnia sp. SECRCQ15]MCH1626431.1 hypothetical protein [Fredinandcohnia sp. SECRCQ15]
MKKLTTFFLLFGLILSVVGCSSDKQSADEENKKDKTNEEVKNEIVEEISLGEDQAEFLNGLNKELDNLINFYIGLKNNESLLSNASVKDDFNNKHEAFTTLLTQYNEEVKSTLPSGNIVTKFDELMKEAVTATDLLKKAVETDDLETFHEADAYFVKTASLLQEWTRSYSGKKM